jgi:hypothetical protein
MVENQTPIGKIKSGIEWIEHFNTVKDAVLLLLSIGGGSLVKNLAEAFGSIPPAWATTIWILATGLFLLLGTLIVRKFGEKHLK